MKVSEANQLLDQFTLPLETGWIRLESGALHVAVRTPMVGCTSDMIDWWFTSLRSTKRYKLWHPRQHVLFEIESEAEKGKLVGRTVHVHEYVGSDLLKIRLDFLDPADILDKNRFAETNVGTVIYAKSGVIGVPGSIGRVVHLVQDTPDGCVMRSRFWLGEFEPALDPKPTPEMISEKATDELARNLMIHSTEEMAILANILPNLYNSHNPGTV